jgi:starvation-inducible DNA-binding protein
MKSKPKASAENKMAEVTLKKTSVRASHYDAERARPIVHQDGVELQPFNVLVKLPIGLGEEVCRESVERLNQILADTMTLRDLYHKHHWQVAGSTFYQLHLLFDKHYDEQAALVDKIAERIQMLGGLSYAMAADVAENTTIPRPDIASVDRPRNRDS